MGKIIFLLIFLNLSVLIDAIIEENLILQYFQMKYINQVSIFSCEDVTKYLMLLKNLMKSNMYVSFIDMGTFDDTNVKNLIIKHGSHGFVLDSDCGNCSIVLHQCAEEDLFFDKYKWLIFSQNGTVLKILEKTYMNVNTEITVATRSSEQFSWSLLDVYNPGYKHGGTLKVQDIGTWDDEVGFRKNENDSTTDLAKYIKRKDLSELHFKGMIVIIHEYPGELLDYLYNNEDKKMNDIYSRYYFLLFNHAKDLHNFSLSFEPTPYFGTMSPNGSFNGVIGGLQRREIDVGLTSVFYKTDRFPFVDNLVPTYLMKPRFLFLRPKPPLTIGGEFFSPLDNTVWAATWGVMLVTAIIIRMTFKEECELAKAGNEKNHFMEHDWSFIALLIFGGICQQDVPHIPSMYSGRIVVFFSVFFTYMLYQFYSGGIVSSLLSEPPTTIKNLQDLIDSNLHVGIEDIVFEKMFLFESTDPLIIQLYNKKIKGKMNGSDAFYDGKIGMDMVQKGDFAFQIDTSTGYAIIAEEFSNEQICELGEVSMYQNRRMGGVVQQDSPFRELFVYIFQRMVEAGLVHRQRIRWTTRKPACIKVVDSSTIFVGIREFFPALLFYMIGIVAAIIIFLAEIYVYRNMQLEPKKFVFIN